MSAEPGRERHDIEKVLSSLHKWIRKNTLMLAPLNLFEPDQMWFGPTSMELTMLFPGMQRNLVDAKEMARELVAFLRCHQQMVRVGMLHLHADVTAPIISMRIQSMLLPEHMRRESMTVNFGTLKALNQFDNEVRCGRGALQTTNIGAAGTAVQRMDAQQHPQYWRQGVQAQVLGAPGSADDCAQVATDRNYALERATALRACLAAASTSDQLRSIQHVLGLLGIDEGTGPNRSAGAGAGDQVLSDLVARS